MVSTFASIACFLLTIWHVSVIFDFLSKDPLRVKIVHIWHCLWSLPREEIFNYNQVLLTFVERMDSYCTSVEDSDTHNAWLNESLHKRHTVVRTIASAEEWDNKIGFTNLVRKVSLNVLREKYEIAVWSSRSLITFQINTLAGAMTMI